MQTLYPTHLTDVEARHGRGQAQAAAPKAAHAEEGGEADFPFMDQVSEGRACHRDREGRPQKKEPSSSGNEISRPGSLSDLADQITGPEISSLRNTGKGWQRTCGPFLPIKEVTGLYRVKMQRSGSRVAPCGRLGQWHSSSPGSQNTASRRRPGARGPRKQLRAQRGERR